MSEPIRYTIIDRQRSKNLETPLIVSKDGELVLWEDYAILKQENERLRSAGGWLYTELQCFHRNEFCDHPDYQEERPSMIAWNSAKGENTTE